MKGNSILYKDSKDQTLTVEVKQFDGKISFLFEKDFGKFGTIEPVDSYTLTIDRLLEILQERDDYTDEELD